jgi:bisphosphoglycerate-dependent phosphoglycerate mutase
MVLENISSQAIPNLNIPTGVPIRYVFDGAGKLLEHGYVEG